LPVVQADSNHDPLVATDWGPAMSRAGWQAALDEVAARSDIAGFVVFPGTSLIDDGRGEMLQVMVGKQR
jgi:hypothetical protein